MKNKAWKIKFKDEDYVLANETKNEGPIVKYEDLIEFKVGYAHLFPNGEVRQYSKVIGTIDDINFLEEIEFEFEVDGLETALNNFFKSMHENNI